MWVHAVSVGEVQAAVPFIKAAREDGWEGPFVISTTTQTGRAMAERLGKDLYDFHIYYPWDKNLFVRRALDALNPAAFAAAETELWPNMLSECRDRGIPAFLINGRISDRTWARVQGGLRRPLARGAYSLFASLFLRDEEDRERLTRIGVEEKKLFVMGDGKVDALLARRNEAARDKLAAELGEPERPIFIAGSTHTGEDEKVLAAFAILRGRHPEARLVIAPRHPERAAAVASLVPAEYRTAMFSGLTAGWDVLIIDRIGVLFDLYGASRSAFVGGSFADKGGQNILEPFSWGVPVQYGELTNCLGMVELGIPRLGYMPELSYGTHFFSDLEVDGVLYMPVFAGEDRNIFNVDWFERSHWTPWGNDTIRVYKGDFAAYMDGEKNRGVIVEKAN